MAVNWLTKMSFTCGSQNDKVFFFIKNYQVLIIKNISIYSFLRGGLRKRLRKKGITQYRNVYYTLAKF